jgi:hypothetical protein
VSDGVLTAHPALKGTFLQSIKDKDGKAFGEEMMKVATDGSIGKVSYMGRGRARPPRRKR